MRQVSGVRAVDAAESGGEVGWVPVEGCMLPSAEQPLRVAEFDELFASSVRGVTILNSSSVRLELDASAESRARDLAARESGCCSFFAFRFEPSGQGTVWMDVAVPPERGAVLAGLVAQARAAAGRGDITR